ncbi:MAG: EamA family transporter [Clostridiaceae bacterium]|nr:EamA family transporter [Clostridiaceae bacterium]
MKKTYLFSGVSIFCWSTVAVTTKLLLGTINNIQLLWMSSLFAGVFLFIVNLVTGNIKRLKSYTMKDYLISALIGLPGTFLYYMFYYAGANAMPASQAFIINYLWPIMSMVFACIILKEQMTVRKIAAIILSFFGVGIVTFGKAISLNKDTLLGAIFCIFGAVSYGVFTSLNQKMNYDKRISMMLNYCVTFILTSIINIVNNDMFIPNVVQILGFAWNGIFTMAVASTMWIIALESGETAKISNLAYITPFLSLV